MNGKKETFTIRPFEKLQKAIERQRTAAAPQARRPKKKEEYTDEELFSKAMNEVEEITSFRALSCRPNRVIEAAAAAPRNPDKEVLAVLDGLASGHLPINLPDTQEYVEWTNPDYHDEIVTKLHDGLFSVQAYLDLHGCTVGEAEAEMDAFLRDAFVRGVRCIKIIHGRGLRSLKGPRIKEALLRRLAGRYRKNIVAYSSARQCDGGLGAVYVLLAKRKALSP